MIHDLHVVCMVGEVALSLSRRRSRADLPGFRLACLDHHQCRGNYTTGLLGLTNNCRIDVVVGHDLGQGI